MQPQRPVYWYSGQFLEPQHFQQADAFHASERASLLQSAQPCFWGVGNLDVDEAALAEGRILVRSGIIRFQDGTEVVIAAVPEDVLKGIISQIPVGRLGRGEEIADMVAFLAGEHAGYVTGATLSLNGGQYMAG